MNGRHYGTRDKGPKGNGISLFLISQSLHSVSKNTRLNLDCWLVNALQSYRERMDILDSCFYLKNSPQERQYARSVYETLTQGNFSFLAIECHRQNKRSLVDYIKQCRVESEIAPFRFFGSDSEWEGVPPFDV